MTSPPDLEMRPQGYTVLGIYEFGANDPSLFSDKEGRIVVFDTLMQARHFVPRLGGGRPTTWSGDDKAHWGGMQPGLPSRVVLIDRYDVYNLPPNHPVRSEAKSIDWRNHTHYHEWWQSEGRVAMSNSRQIVPVLR